MHAARKAATTPLNLASLDRDGLTNRPISELTRQSDRDILRVKGSAGEVATKMGVPEPGNKRTSDRTDARIEGESKSSG